MTDSLKNRAPFSTSIDKNLLQELDRITKETRIPKSKLMDEAIEWLIEKYPSKGENKEE